MKDFSISAFSPLPCTLLFILTFSQAHAETVQRWQDPQGQWHFGDAAATHDRHAQPVPIHSPISVVHNDHPTAANITTEKHQKSKKSKPKTTHSSNNTQALRCEKMREKVNQQPASRKAISARQDLISQYEKQCVIGNYYGG